VDARGVIPTYNRASKQGWRILGHAAERLERRVEARLFRLGEGAALLGDDHDDAQVLGHQVFRATRFHMAAVRRPYTRKVPVVNARREERRLAHRLRQTVQSLRLLPLLLRNRWIWALTSSSLQAAS